MTTLVVLCVLGISDVEPPAFFAGNEELRAYLLEAGQNHPGLEMRYEQWLATLETIPQAKSFDDPMFSYGQFLRSDTARFKLALNQKFPWFRTRKIRSERAAEQAEAALDRLYGERNRVFAGVKRAYFEYAFLAENIRVLGSQIEILEYVRETAEARYALAMAGQDDVIRAQLAQTELEDRRDGLEQYRSALSAQLCEAVGRDTVEELPWPQPVEFPPSPPPAPIVSARLRVVNPDLAALGHLIQSRQKGVVLAKKKGYPDFTFGIEYTELGRPPTPRPDRPYPSTLSALARQTTNLQTRRGGLARAYGQLVTGQAVQLPASQTNATSFIDLYSVLAANEPMRYSRSPEDNLMVSMKVNVPIWRKHVKAGVEEARHLEQAARHDKRRQANALNTAARQAHYEIADAQRRLEVLQGTLVEQARQIYESLQTAYAAGQQDAGFLDVLDSVNTMLDFELEQAQVTRNLHQAAAQLELLLGGPWTSESEQEASP